MQWEQFFYATGIPALVLAPDHTILSANPASCSLTAKTGPELRGRKCYEIFHGPCATQPPNGCPMERALATKKHATADMEVSFGSGWYRMSCTPVIDEQGRISSIVHIATDIMEKKALQMAEERMDQFQLLTNTLPDMVYLIDPCGKVLYANPAAARQFGLDPADLVGKTLTALFPPNIAHEHLEDIRTVASTRRPMQREITEVFPSGRIHIEVRLTPVIDPMDRVTGVLGISRDITAAKEAEIHLRQMNVELENRNRLINTLLDTVPVGIFMVEAPSGRPVIANAAATRLMGRGVMPDATKENLAEVYEAYRSGTTDRYPPEMMPIVTGMRGESRHIDDMEVVRPDGTRTLLEVFGNPVYDSQNRVAASLASFLDITERKRAEEQREQLISELARKNAELDRFTYTVSHDLKSPLISLRAFLVLLEDDLKSGREDRVTIDIARMSESAERLETMITTLLDLSRSGRNVTTPLPVPFESVVRDAASLLEPAYRQRGVELKIADNLPVVMGDRQRLLQVMTNLLDNAVKYMGDQEHPRVEVGVQGEPGGPVFFVWDNGRGICPDDLPRVFGLYERFAPDIPGTGIGLSTVERIIGAHGGKIRAESEGEGKGATFRFTLPLAAGITGRGDL